MSKSLSWPRVDLKVWLSLTYTALVVTMIDYFGKSNHALELFPAIFEQHAEPAVQSFSTTLYWIFFGIIFYFFIPWLLIYFQGEKLSQYGVRLPSSYGHLWIYGAMLVAVIVIAYFASFQESFLKQYPYYKYYREEPWLYALFWIGRSVRFFALEFFFRGYLLFSLKPKMGDASFFVSMIPYCMLHFGKPFPETIFAIIGGIIFCWIAARTHSIWGAVVLHVALAMAMDAFAIAQHFDYI